MVNTFVFEWNTIEITVRYNSDFSTAYRDNTGGCLAHLEIISDSSIPITETGYKSLFAPAQYVESMGGAARFVQEWLDNEAQKSNRVVRRYYQLSLF